VIVIGAGMGTGMGNGKGEGLGGRAYRSRSSLSTPKPTNGRSEIEKWAFKWALVDSVHLRNTF